MARSARGGIVISEELIMEIQLLLKTKNQNIRLWTRKIVIFIAKYLRDYKNSHIFVSKD
jgi:ribosomal protein S19